MKYLLTLTTLLFATATLLVVDSVTASNEIHGNKDEKLQENQSLSETSTNFIHNETEKGWQEKAGEC
jgi:hypothetical protein